MLNVQNVTHGFGERQILDNASFRMKKGEHIGLVGANGEGKTTFLNIITGVTQADEGTVTWAKRATVGYLDQHSVLQRGMTIRDVLRTAFKRMYELEADMLTVKHGPTLLIPKEWKQEEGAGYFEAPSMRKINNRY